MRILGVIVVCACALGIFAGSAHGAPGVKFGIQDDAWLEFGPGRLSERVAKLDRLGIDVVRVTLDWHRVEARQGRYSWARSDRILRALRARGLEPVVTLWGTPAWANGGAGPNVAPLDGADFQRFAEAAALRYPFVAELDHVERAEQADLAPARVGENVRSADSQSGLPRHQGGQPACARGGWGHGTACRQGRDLASGFHPRDGSRRRAPRRLRPPSVPDLSG